MRLFLKPNGYWYISLKRGHEKSLKTKDKDLAQRAYTKLRKTVLQGKLASIDPDKNISLRTFIGEYLRITGPGKSQSSRRSDKLSLETFTHSLKAAGDSRPLNTITRKHLDEMISELQKQGLSHETINTYIRRIKGAMNMAVEWKYLAASPFMKVKQVKGEDKIPRFLHGKEIKLLFKAITDLDFKNMVYLYIHTGCRRAELVRLKWKDVETMSGRWVITVEKTKTHTQRIVKANTEAARVIEGMARGEPGDYVFPRWRTPDAVTRLFRKYADASGIPHIRLHDLRHTTASHMVMAGVPLKTVAQVLGHSRTSTTDIYAHLVPEHLEDAMSKLEIAFNRQEIETPNLVSVRKSKTK